MSRSTPGTSTKGARCCTLPRLILFVVILGVVGALLWLFVPWDDFGSDVPFVEDDHDSSTPSTPAPSSETFSTPSPTPSTSFYRCTQEEGCCNGIDGLCDQGVDQVLFATSHNSFAASDNGFLVFPNHNEDLEASLLAGYRGLNLDMCNCEGTYVLCHGMCTLGQRDPKEVLTNVKTFLDQNPTEIVIISLQINSGADMEVNLDVTGDIVAQSGLSSLLYVLPDDSSQWPTLGDMKANGTRAVLFYFNAPACSQLEQGCPYGFHNYFEHVSETEFSFSSVEKLEDTAVSCEITRGRMDGTNPFFAVNAFVTLPNRKASRTINTATFLNAHLDACSFLNGDQDVNFLMVDFWHEGNVLEVVQSRNAALVAQRKSLLRRNK